MHYGTDYRNYFNLFVLLYLARFDTEHRENLTWKTYRIRVLLYLFL